MTKQEFLLRALCKEVVMEGIHTDRFTELWLESGVNLDGSEFEIANKILQRYDEESVPAKNHTRTIQ